MIRKVNGNTYFTDFNSVSDLINFIDTKEPYDNFKNKKGGCDSISGDKSFTETESFDEAKDLLLHGWECGTRRIRRKLDFKNTENVLKQKPCYDIQGYQCSVPRYLQGIPTNMINNKVVTQKNKVITINKMCTYYGKVTTSQIIDESVKVLKLINELEKQGYRVNLNVIFGSRKIKNSMVRIKIKQSSQRMNLKQMAFPLVHPSMLRRIIFAVWERCEENSTGGFEYGYGAVMDRRLLINELKKITNVKGEYLIPNIVNEEEITDIEKYKIN